MSAFVVFTVADRLCALPTAAVREVLPMATLARPPGLPPVIDGFLDLAGTAVAVVPLARLFEMPAPALGRTTALLLLRGTSLALQVDEVRAVLSLDAAIRHPLEGAMSFRGCVIGEATMGDERIALLSAERLLLREEEERLRQLQAIEQRRLDAVRAAVP